MPHTTQTQLELRVRYLSIILVFASGFVTLVVSIAEIRRTIDFADLLYIKANVSYTDRRIRDILERYAPEAEGVYEGAECGSSVLEAAIALLLADLDHKDPERDFDLWVIAAKRAEAMLEHATICEPAKSDHWLRLAMIKRASGESADEQARLMSQAVFLDPASIAGLRSRFALWCKLGSESLRVSRPALEKDLNTLLEFASPTVVREVLKHSGKPMQPYLWEAFKQVSQERQERLERWKALPDQARFIRDQQVGLSTLVGASVFG